ncbi:glycoside hydrolase family 15 protein, partial [Pseudohyphozyma bogoriensis]
MGENMLTDALQDAQDHGMIGNCRTAALVSISGTVAQLCWPDFDSPSVFARILDKDHGGHFAIRTDSSTSTKQQYLPSTNILITKFLSDEGVGQIQDFMPLSHSRKPVLGASPAPPFLPWLIRRVEVIRGSLPFTIECAPAFNYARSSHETTIHKGDHKADSAEFICPEHVDLELRVVRSKGLNGGDGTKDPEIEMDYLDLSGRGHKGLGVTSSFTLKEGESVTFVLSEKNKKSNCGEETKEQAAPALSETLIQSLLAETTSYWLSWISQCTYKGRWREFMQRSALALKLLTYAPTGALVAAPTFSIPEDLHGAGRNWDYRYSWLRDSSFSVYALLRLGFTEEADQYMDWLFSLLDHKNEDGGLQIMYTIHSEKDMEEFELPHLDGHKSQKPVRIGNGAMNHLQLDIYGELMDSIYLSQKMSKPMSWERWVKVRSLVDYVCTVWDQPDLSIWEVRGERQNFLYSKVMCWVAIDRGLRLADKRSFPAPNRNHWIAVRDQIYEEIQEKGYNKEGGFYAQSYENIDVLDSSVCVMPLTFFLHANDPRFISTIKKILEPRDRGGLTENNLVYRYDTNKVDDGTGGGEEGAFSMCTLWVIEALARAGEFDKDLLATSVGMLEDFMGYSNHLGLLSEEISKGGEPLGNFPQAFSHVGLISTCFNVDKHLKGHFRPSRRTMSTPSFLSSDPYPSPSTSYSSPPAATSTPPSTTDSTTALLTHLESLLVSKANEIAAAGELGAALLAQQAELEGR